MCPCSASQSAASSCRCLGLEKICGRQISIPSSTTPKYDTFLTLYKRSTLTEINPQWFYASQPFYIMAVFCTKLSLVVLYLRIWPRMKGERWTLFHSLCWIMIFVLIGTAIGATLAMIFACHPFSNAWRYANRAMGTCTDRVAGAYAYGGLNIVYDIIVIALPVPRLMKLKVSMRQKIG